MLIAETQTRPAPVRCALAGFGRRGLELARAARGLPQIEIVAVADAYDGRLERAREVLGGSIATARDATAVIGRSDVEAVLIATPDHLHAAHVAAARRAGKVVYCEHPLVHTKEDLESIGPASGTEPIAGAGLLPESIVGGARDIVREGRLGELTLVTGWWDTGTALDAWILPFPPDASPESIEWNAFAGASGEFNPAHFFRWPAFSAYGSGLIGARFVPQLWDIHRMLDLPPPDRCSAAGRVARWKDGRDTPDVIGASFEYPTVTIELGATLNGSGRTQEIRLIGADATLVLCREGLALIPQQTAEPVADLGDTWAEPLRRWVFMMHGLTPDGRMRGTPPVDKTVEKYTLPSSGHELTPSLSTFVDSVRSGRPPAGIARGAAVDVARAGLMCGAALAAGRMVSRRDVFGNAA